MGMDSKKIQEELQFLLEEDNRVITYKFVSANFGIHVNEAKRHLQSLWSASRGRGDDDLTATYFVSGLCDGDGDCVSQKALVVSEDQLAAARDSLTSVTSEHVYSLQRHRVCDTTVLYGADLQERQADPVAFNSHGAITNPRAERIPEAELLKARQASVVTAVTSQPPKRPAAPAPAAVKKEPAAAASQKPSEASPANQKPSEASPANQQSSKAAEHDAASGGQTAKASTATKGGSIASMFAKAATDKKTKSPPKKAAGGRMMASFLQKGAEQKPPTAVSDTSPAAPAPAAAKDAEPSTAVKAEPEPAAAEPVRFGAKKGSGAGKKGAAAGRKRPRKAEGGGPARQRRRIQVLASDSSDSSDENDDREEPEPEPEPAPPIDSDDEEKPAAQPRRKRKLVTKTFVDDEGFMVTKKEYESCSGSDSEEPPAKTGPVTAEKRTPAPDPTPSEPAKPKEAAPHKVKQVGIMNFFKKK